MPKNVAGKIYNSNQEVYNQLGLYAGASQAGIKGKLQNQQINALEKDLTKPVNNNVSIKSMKKQIQHKANTKTDKNLNSAQAYYLYKQKLLTKNQFINIIKNNHS